ncbi:DUF6624 domain-containing protein [Flavobacterium sp. M31R6]|uniref:DUF6624 domain-containing protein n=1 Tax=Flavobacterium sp. M31R6 TaxID=2739062 RepID=UPI0015686A6F|nr:DUF6624 domain-containing protein [Flavobacterium sp. M31R6]QKJ64709.1 hypothetical protein HQN62_16735 [Flavobacterium sp. M31R6]
MIISIVNRYSLVLLLFVFVFCHAQGIIDEGLKKELDGIYKSDQILREYIDSETTDSRKLQILNETGYSNDDLANGKVYMILNKRDSINLIRIEEIIAKFGYPGKTLVGEPTNEAAWYVIQHSKKIADYFPMIQEAGASNEIPFTKVAMMHDRMLMQEGKEQLYGTQVSGQYILNAATGKKEFWYCVWPILNAESVNELRKEAGFTNTVEEYAKSMGVEYKRYTLAEIKQLTIKE